MFGKNPIRKPLKGSGDVLEVQEIFPTIQGEGPNTGVPAIFIRLGGCNLACKFCDTEFESFQEMRLVEIMEVVQKMSQAISPPHPPSQSYGETRAGGGISLVVITGGEPLRQPIERLCQELISKGFRVQIETNGTLYRELPEEVEIVCSPKNTGKGYAHIREDLLERVSAFKFIVSANDNLYLDIAEVGQSTKNIPVYIQPMDECDKTKNANNVKHAVNLTKQHGAILSLQTHKILGLP